MAATVIFSVKAKLLALKHPAVQEISKCQTTEKVEINSTFHFRSLPVGKEELEVSVRKQAHTGQLQSSDSVSFLSEKYVLISTL